MGYNVKNILIAVDDSENAMRAVKYAGTIVGTSQGFSVTLLNIVRYPSRDHFPDSSQWEEACVKFEQKGKDALEQAVKELVACGLDRSAISTRIVKSHGTSIASEIMKVQQEGGFGTVALGRRGVTKQEEFLFGSVSNKVVHYAKDCTVWVVE